MCNLNAFDRLDKDAKKLLTDEITDNSKSLMSVSKNYDHDLLNSEDIKNLGLLDENDRPMVTTFYNHVVIGNSIALKLNTFKDSIACIFTVAHEGETTSTTVLILSLEEYHEDYLKQKLDTLVEKWIADKRLAQEVQVKSVQKQLSKTSEEAKAA